MLRTGDTVRFGQYRQENRKKQDILWQVLDIQGNNALLLASSGLATLPYHEKKAAVDWAGSSVRAWLNEDFLVTAFTEEERAAILLTHVDNSKNQGYPDWPAGGKNTDDRVFLLSYREAFTRYFPDGDARRCVPTYMAQADMENKNPDSCVWWLRSPGNEPGRAACVWSDGARHYLSVNAVDVCVRPALWVDMTLWPFSPKTSSFSFSSVSASPSAEPSSSPETKNHFDFTVDASWLDCYTLTWTPLENVHEYIIRVFSDESLQNLYTSKTVRDTDTAYINTDVGEQYYFRMGYKNENGQSYFPDGFVTVLPKTPLPAPDNLTYSFIRQNVAEITWDPVPNALGYRIYWSADPKWRLGISWRSQSRWIDIGSDAIKYSQEYIDLSHPSITLYGMDRFDTLYIWVCADNGDGPNLRSSLTIHSP